MRTGRATAWTWAWAIALAARGVGAQPTPPPPPGARAGSTPGAPTEPSPETLETARRLFREGVAAAQQENWAEARERFARALAIHPSPLLRFNLALADRNVGRLVEAIDQYRQFVREATDPANAPRRAAAQAEIAALEPRLAYVRVEVTGDRVRTLRLDGRELPSAMVGVEIPVDPGPHVVEVEGERGDVQRSEGAVLERARERVPFALAARRAPPAAGDGAWQPRTQSFGRWVARPGPGGRWLDWASQEPAASAVWTRHQVTLALMGGVNAPLGLVAVSARYFPQRWFGLEGAVGGAGGWGVGLGVAAHLRFTLGPASRHAFGVAAGVSTNATALALECAGAACNSVPQTLTRDLWPAWLSVGLTYEWRVTRQIAVRGVLGWRGLTNPAAFRDAADHGLYGCSGTATFSHPCEAYRGDAGAPLFTTLDVGYAL